MVGAAVQHDDGTAVELATFILSIAAVLMLAIFTCVSRPGLQFARRLGLSVGSRSTGALWSAASDDGGEDEHLFVTGLGLLGGGGNETPTSGSGGGGSSVVRVRVQLSATGSDELELDTAGMRNVGEVRATVAACYAAGEETANELAQLMVVRCLDEERGLLVSLPGRTPLESLGGPRELIVQFTVAAQRERQRAGAAEISSRAVGASVFARRQEALLTPSGTAGSERGGRVHLLQALPRALSWAFGGRRVAEQPFSSELSRRLLRLHGPNDASIGRLSGLRPVHGGGRDSIDDDALGGILAMRRRRIDEAGEALAAAGAPALPQGPPPPEPIVGGTCPVLPLPPPPLESVGQPTPLVHNPTVSPPSTTAPATAAIAVGACGGSGGSGSARATGGGGGGGFLHSAEFAAKLEARKHSIEVADGVRAPSAAVAARGGAAGAGGGGAGLYSASDGMSYLDQLAERIAARASAKSGHR